jgi:PAS domain S-box-containing protein
MRTEGKKQTGYLQLMLENSPDVMIFLDRDGFFQYCSTAFLELTGIRDFGRVAGKNFREVYRAFGGQEFAEQSALRFEQVRKGHKTITENVLIDFSGGGKYRRYTISSIPMLDEEDDFDGVLAIYHDITDLFREEDERARELEIQTRAAQVASEAKSKFLASMSHEIRTPMNAIIGMSDLMRTDNLDETQREFFTDIKKMSKYLLQLINDILDISKIEAGKLEILPIHFNLPELYDNICSLNRFTAESKDLQWRQSFDPALPSCIYGDDVRIRQVITNLVNNAIKYTKEGFVDFSVRRITKDTRDCVAIIVKDTGIGIKKEDFPKLFGAFEQADAASNRGITGTGLGLTITKNLLSLMGGEIGFESEYGAGSVFTALLPLVPGDPAKVEKKNLRSVVTAVDARVLVVDDNGINLKVALAFLAVHGIHADSAENGAEAIGKIQKNPYDLVFMDHMMPEMDGIEATRRIRALEGERFRTMPIIALTANAVSGARESFLAAGMDDFISKPIDAEELNRKLAKWLPKDKALIPADRARSAPQEEAAPGYRSAAPPESGPPPVLDRAAGLRNTGGEELYRQLLNNFREDHRADGERIGAALAAGDNALAYRLAHTLKSTAALLGAEAIRRTAAVLEKFLAEENSAAAAERQGDLEKEFAVLLKELNAFQPEELPPAQNRERAGPDRIRDLAERLTPLLASGDTRSLEMLDEIGEKISGLDGRGDLLVKQIERFEFESALATLRDLRNQHAPP